MGSAPNNHYEKREEQHDTHNRKPGSGKWWKKRSNRKGRRWGNRINNQMVEGRRPII